MKDRTERRRIQRWIKEVIQSIWENKIKKDYKDHWLLKEDSFKCAFYYHMRNEFKHRLAVRNHLCIFTEYYFKQWKRADLVIAQIKDKDYDDSKHLKCNIESILAIIELKYKIGKMSKQVFFKDLEKLKNLRKRLDQDKEVSLYAGFIFEICNGTKEWLADLKKLSGDVTVCAGYIEDSELQTRLL